MRHELKLQLRREREEQEQENVEHQSDLLRSVYNEDSDDLAQIYKHLFYASIMFGVMVVATAHVLTYFISLLARII